MAWNPWGGREKCDNLRECINEAARMDQQRFVRNAETITLIRDESKGILLIRLLACDNKLKHRVFTLGLRANAGSDAFDIDEATRDLIHEFCTPLGDVAPDLEMVNRMCSKVEAICVDSAANELKASRIMIDSFAPNLKAVIRDRAHAARRILSRPWKADPFLYSLAQTFIMDRRSICQRIQHSTDFRALFARNVKNHVYGPFRNTLGLGAAKHRFESWTKPFGMLIMTLPALVRTAEEISIRRAGQEEGRDADFSWTPWTQLRVCSWG
jgi:hypothetical protein